MIFISTGGFNSLTASETSSLFYENGINSIELSGGRFSHVNIKELMQLSKKINFQVHNYFPRPKSLLYLT